MAEKKYCRFGIMPHCIQLPETPVLQLLWNYKTHEALQDSHSHRHDFQRQMHHGICSFTTDGGDWTLPIPALKVCYFGSVVYVTPSEDQDGGVCVAVIAKENYPLYIRSIPTEDQLKFHYTTHTSPDVVDEKISAMGKALVDQRELYLGLLYATEDYKVYGYVTNSKVKFVMVVDSSNTDFRNNEIRSMFRKLHNSYTDVMCNPFYNPGDTIQSRAFDNTVSSMMVPAC